MTTIGLIRHGITEWNSLGKAQGVSDIPLNEIGKKQALSMDAIRLIFYKIRKNICVFLG